MVKRLLRGANAAMALLVLAPLTACVGVGDHADKRLQARPMPVSTLADHAPVLSEPSVEIDTGLSKAQARRALLGKWYGINETGSGVRKEWLVERAADGTYRTDFRSTSPDGKISSQSEVGFWGLSGDVYFRIFRGWVMVDGMKPADPTDPGHYDAYRIELLNSAHMRYRHLDHDRVYTMKKMPDSFRLPVVLESREEAPLKFEF